jgi:diguanylate cyclase (GGDEF)-like protein/PAS domain S-box-containing protein
VRQSLRALTGRPAGLTGLWLAALALCLLGAALLSGSSAAQTAQRVARAGEIAAGELAPALLRADGATLGLQARALLAHREIGFAWLRVRDAQGRAVAAAGRLETGTAARLPSGLRRQLYQFISSDHRVPLLRNGLEIGSLEFGLLIGGGGLGVAGGRMGAGLLALLLGLPLLLWLSLRLKDALRRDWSAGSARMAQSATATVLQAGGRDAAALTRAGSAPATAAGELLAVFNRGALFVDRNQSVQDLNAEAERLTGWTAAEARHRPLSEVLPLYRDDAQRQVALPLEGCFSGAQARLQGRYRLHARDGSRHEVDIDAGPVRDPTGYIGGVLISLSVVPGAGRVLQTISPAAALEPEQDRRQLSQMLLDQVLECVVTTDSQDRIQFANGRALENFGYSLPELRGEHISRLLPEPFLRRPQARIADLALELPDAEPPTVTARRRDGSQYAATLVVHPVSVRGQQGNVVTIRPSAAAVAERQRLGPRLRHLLENAPDELYVADPDSLHLIAANRQALQHLGFSVEQLRQTTLLRLCPRLAPETLRAHVARLREGSTDIVELRGWHQRAAGSGYEVQSRLSLWSGEGAPVLLLAAQPLAAAGRPEAELREARLEFLAQHDALTGLPNRKLLMARLDQAIAADADGARPLALVHLALAGLDALNPAPANDVLDPLLKAVADRLSAAVRASDTVARLEGVEFALLLQPKRREDLGELLKRLRMLLTRPLRVGAQDITVDVHAGAAVYPGDADAAEPLMHRAAQALREAMARGPVLTSPPAAPVSMPAAATEPAMRLREAQERGELAIQLQPLMDVRARLVVGAEVLMAWRYPGHSLLRTAEQIEQAGADPALSAALAPWVLERACEQQANWRNLELQTLPLLVNLTALPLAGRHTVQGIRSLLAHYRVPPEQLIVMVHAGRLEALLLDVDSWLPVLRDLGLRLGVHDVDPARTDLLRRADVDVVRLTPRSIAGLPASREASEQSLAIIQAGQRVGARIFASGVERAEQREALLALGCHIQQGRLLGEPLSPQEFARSLLRSEIGAI